MPPVLFSNIILPERCRNFPFPSCLILYSYYMAVYVTYTYFINIIIITFLIKNTFFYRISPFNNERFSLIVFGMISIKLLYILIVTLYYSFYSYMRQYVNNNSFFRLYATASCHLENSSLRDFYVYLNINKISYNRCSFALSTDLNEDYIIVMK